MSNVTAHPDGRLEIEIEDQWDGQRVDKVLVRALAGPMSRARARELFAAGSVRVNGRVAPKGSVARRGDLISIDAGVSIDQAAIATSDAILDVRLERSDIVVLHKPAGQPTAPVRPGETGTLVNALVGRYPSLAGIGYGAREPGIIHRLDTGTSGLVVAARHLEAFAALVQGLRRGEIEKRYLLICAEARLADSGVIDFALRAHPKDARRVMVCNDARHQGRASTTSFRVLERAGRFALVEASAPRAMRHQLRVHFAAIEHPLVGDPIYGGLPLLPHQALHAHYVRWKGDSVVPAFEVQDELPGGFRELLRQG